MDKHIFLPESKVLTSKEDEAVVILGATQKKWVQGQVHELEWYHLSSLMPWRIRGGSY